MTYTAADRWLTLLWTHGSFLSTKPSESSSYKKYHISPVSCSCCWLLLISNSVLVARTAHRSVSKKTLSTKEIVLFTISVSLICGYLSSKPTLKLYHQYVCVLARCGITPVTNKEMCPFKLIYPHQSTTSHFAIARLVLKTNYSPSDRSICNCGTSNDLVRTFDFWARVKNARCH